MIGTWLVHGWMHLFMVQVDYRLVHGWMHLFVVQVDYRLVHG
jgi:mannose/fructose/N-acetylgalactosamine-specific phosphotransferase system component IIB